MVVVERASPGLPPVPVDDLAGRALRQIDEQQLQRIDELPKLPIGQLRLGRYLLEVTGDLLRRHLRQGRRTARLQEPFDPADIPGAHLLRDAAMGQEVQVAVPIGRSAVLAASRGKGRHDDRSHRVVKATSEFSLVH